MANTTHTILVTVFEGRNFVKKPDQVYIQCRFNNEILTTDPVLQSSSPIWDTELAWDIDHKLLSYLRSQRATLKLVVYSINGTSQREPLGYVILDLRAATAGSPPHPDKWYPLINSLPLNLAEHLDLLVKDTSITTPYYFYYTFLGNDIMTKQFFNLKSPNFPAERVSIKFQAWPKDLIELLNNLSKLVVYLCNEETVLGFSDISLTTLSLKVKSNDMLIEENVYPLYSTHLELKLDHDAHVPAIGVSMALSLGFNNSDPQITSGFNRSAVVKDNERVDVNKENIPNSTLKSNSSERAAEVQVDRNLMTPPPFGAIGTNQTVPSQNLKNIIQEIETSDQTKPVSSSTPSASILMDSNKNVNEMPIQAPKTQLQSNIKPNKVTKSWDETVEDIPTRDRDLSHISESYWNQYRFSIELRSVRNFRIKSAQIFFKYVYPAFGTSSPIITHPIVQIVQNESDFLLPHSFCAFEFMMETSKLESILDSVPLVVEIWHKDTNKKNQILGNCSIDLSEILQARRLKSNSHSHTTIQTLDVYSGLLALGPASEKYVEIGDLRVLCSLEDFGKVSNELLQKSISQENATELETPTKYETPIHDNPEYEVALEMEIWKQNQQEEFLKKFAEKELDLENHFANEFTKRETERENQLQQKFQEYQTLINETQQLTLKLRQREEVIEKAESDLYKKSSEIEIDLKRELQAQRDASKRLYESLHHSNKLFQQRYEESEKQLLLVSNERDDYRQQLKNLEINLHQNKFNGKENQMDIVKENQKLLKQNQRLTESRHDMKKKYKTLFHLYTQLKDRYEALNEQQKSVQDKQIQDLETKYQHQTEMKQLTTEQSEISRIGTELKNLKVDLFEPHQKQVHVKSNAQPPVGNQITIDRLTKERDLLLETGMYHQKDPLILEIDRKLEQLLV
ncbi:hypothetical protein HDV02_006058 [Globomyces sp. JEL0801]|nr:hypothetical protein HDV02_006058 [Globomyces sp. JEL0801]